MSEWNQLGAGVALEAGQLVLPGNVRDEDESATADTGGAVNASFFKPGTARIKRVEPPPDSTGPKDLAALTSPEIRQAALDARAVIQKRLAGYPQVSPKWREEAARITTRKIATDYRNAIEAIREAATRDELQALQATLQRRLNEGYAMTPNPTRDALWVRLLAEYEIVTDALADNCMWRFMDRLKDLERNVG